MNENFSLLAKLYDKNYLNKVCNNYKKSIELFREAKRLISKSHNCINSYNQIHEILYWIYSKEFEVYPIEDINYKYENLLYNIRNIFEYFILINEEKTLDQNII